jgi:hypothetical protein
LLFAIAMLVWIWHATNTHFDYYSLFFAIVALVVAIIAIAPQSSKKKEEIASVEKCLYCFYYPAVDYIERCSIQGMRRDDADIERIALYRRLAKKETRTKFEKYRNGNYKKDDGKRLLNTLNDDIDGYEKELDKLKGIK